MQPITASLTAAGPIGREDARDLARRELSKLAYHRDDPSLLARIGGWIRDQLTNFGDQVGGAAPGGAVGVFILIAVLSIVAIAIVVRVGGVRRNATAGDPLFAGRIRTPADHRAEAEAAALDGRFDIAVRERLRAIARELESRGLLDPRPGRTADELATDGAAALPYLAVELRAAAHVFDDIWYGGRTATMASYGAVRHADELVRTARITVGTPR